MTSHLGPILRAIRDAAGLSLSAMAERTNFSKGYLGQVECEARRATPTVVAAYENVLAERCGRRSALLAGLLAGAVSTATVFDGVRAGYEALLNDPRPHVDDWLARVDGYGRDYMQLGAARMQQRLAADLIVLRDRIGDSPELWAAAGRLLTVYGKTVPAADEQGAVAWYLTAARAADRSGDLQARVWVRGRAALALAYEGAALTVAETLAEQALAVDDRPSLGALNAHMALAHVAAHRGDRQAALTRATAAERSFDVAGSDEQVSDYAVPLWRMRTFTSMLWSRLGDEPRATAAQDAADAARPDTLPRFAVHIDMHRGLMLARAGDLPGGRAYARAALDALPPERRSLTLRLLMAELDGLAGPGATSTL